MFRHESSASPFPTLAPSVVSSLLARLARREATLIAVEGETVTCQHSGPLKVAATVPFSVTRRGRTAGATATVVSCRVAALGAGEGGSTLYETRILLLRDEDSMGLLRLLEDDFR